MSNSTNIIGDLRTVSAATPTAASTASSIAASGNITDIQGMAQTMLVAAKSMKLALTAIKTASDSGDTNYFTTINNIIGTFGS